jgi:hypothetical protein
MTIKKNIRILNAALLFALLIFAIACGGGDEVRKYKEGNSAKTTDAMPPHPSMGSEMSGMSGMGGMSGPVTTQSHFKWDTPAGWTEDKTASSMRLATFLIKSNGKESVCTMIPLQGEAGGLEANVSRWLDQIKSGGVAIPADVTIEKLIKSHEKFLTKGQFPAALVDYTPVTPKPADKTFIVCVISIDDASIFVKLMGEKSHLIENKAKFRALCESFNVTPPTGK